MCGVDFAQVLISAYNSLGDGRYFDSASQTSFEVDHASQVRLFVQLPYSTP